jgi:hypothetical protein
VPDAVTHLSTPSPLFIHINLHGACPPASNVLAVCDVDLDAFLLTTSPTRNEPFRMKIGAFPQIRRLYGYDDVSCINENTTRRKRITIRA